MTLSLKPFHGMFKSASWVTRLELSGRQRRKMFSENANQRVGASWWCNVQCAICNISVLQQALQQATLSWIVVVIIWLMVQYNRAHKLRSALAKSAASVCAWCVVQCAMCIVHSAMHTEAREGGPDSNCNSGPPLLQYAMQSHRPFGLNETYWTQAIDLWDSVDYLNPLDHLDPPSLLV